MRFSILNLESDKVSSPNSISMEQLQSATMAERRTKLVSPFFFLLVG